MLISEVLVPVTHSRCMKTKVRDSSCILVVEIPPDKAEASQRKSVTSDFSVLWDTEQVCLI